MPVDPGPVCCRNRQHRAADPRGALSTAEPSPADPNGSLFPVEPFPTDPNLGAFSRGPQRRPHPRQPSPAELRGALIPGSLLPRTREAPSPTDRTGPPPPASFCLPPMSPCLTIAVAQLDGLQAEVLDLLTGAAGAAKGMVQARHLHLRDPASKPGAGGWRGEGRERPETAEERAESPVGSRGPRRRRREDGGRRQRRRRQRLELLRVRGSETERRPARAREERALGWRESRARARTHAPRREASGGRAYLPAHGPRPPSPTARRPRPLPAARTCPEQIPHPASGAHARAL